jgi:hypothetical protein
MKKTTKPSGAAPTISVLVTTYNNHATLEACLRSIQQQTYIPLELIVVDNHSSDDTLDIARRFTKHVYTRGPERCAQRNYGIQIAQGDYVVVIDSDMELNHDVLQGCVDVVTKDPDVGGVIIPEESFGQGFWARCKQLERSFYVGVDWIEAARFYRHQTLLRLGGYNESLVSGEDWDLSQRVAAISKLDRTTAFIRHNEGHFKLFTTLRKKAYYAKKFAAYTALAGSSDRQVSGSIPQPDETLQPIQPPNDQPNHQAGAGAGHNPYLIVLRRFGLFLSHPAKLFRNPLTGLGVLFMKVCEFGFGAFGYLMPERSLGKKDAA